MATLLDWKEGIIQKMGAEEIKNFSNEEINRVFRDCVAETLCIKYAHELIDSGQLTWAEMI